MRLISGRFNKTDNRQSKTIVVLSIKAIDGLVKFAIAPVNNAPRGSML